MTTMMPTGGNQCALITSAHSPCRMEVDRETPDWDGCIRNPEVNGTGWRTHSPEQQQHPKTNK